MIDDRAKRFIATFTVATLAFPAVVLFGVLGIATIIFAVVGPLVLCSFYNNYYFLLLYAPIVGLTCAFLEEG